MDQDVRQVELDLTPGKVDAIHRALLTGLLGNVGMKGDASEYEGTRGVRFHLFPGSGLFKARPAWVVAAELVQTTRLYARTVGRIQPQWIERLAGHLLKRTYHEPHWHRPSAHVLAYEKVLLYGLVIVPKRRVHFGPIEPRMCRDLFIDHALVAGEYQTAAPFFQHNLNQIAAVRTLEAKARRHDLLVDERQRFKFYDTRVPEGIYDGPSFEKWRRQAEQGKPRLLFMELPDLLAGPADDITPQRYPDQFTLAGQAVLPLSYSAEPGPLDGVTVTVPLAALNQLPEAPFEWLVPGYLEEKITALIRSLPKQIRVNFVPVPPYAKEAAATLNFGQGSLLAALASYLGKKAGFAISPTSFNLDLLPPWMKMNFRIIDALGKQVAVGRDLAAIRRELKIEASSSFGQGPAHALYHRDNVTRWDFGDLPQRVEVDRHGMRLYGYPALVDSGNSVSLRLLDSPEAASQSMRSGVRKLLMGQLKQEMRDLARHIAGIESMCLHYKLLGSCDELKEQLVTATADRALLGEGVEIRTQAEFVRRAETAWRRLAPVARELEQLTRQILLNYHEVAKALSIDAPPAWLPSFVDMRRQLALLMPRNFLLATPPHWLPHLPRYLKAIELRITKLKNAGLNRDLQALATIEPFDRQYRQRAAEHRQRSIVDPELSTFRWMTEELRVSLFTQELKAAIPISPQRLQKQWEKVREPL